MVLVTSFEVRFPQKQCCDIMPLGLEKTFREISVLHSWLHFGLQRVTEKQNKVVITDRMWARLLSSTNQPSFLSPIDMEQVKKEDEPANQLFDQNSIADDYHVESTEGNNNGLPDGSTSC